MKNKTKTLWIVLSIALLLTVSVGSTLAYLITSSEDVENTFTPSEVKCSIHEEKFDPDGTKEGVTVTNDGNIDAYIRAAIVVTWKDAQGNVYGGGKPAASTDYTITMGNGWTKNGDFWYCDTKVSSVEPNNKTPDLIETCSPIAGRTPAGYGLNVEILAQAIQAEGMGVTSAQAAFAAAKNGN